MFNEPEEACSCCERPDEPKPGMSELGLCNAIAVAYLVVLILVVAFVAI